MLSYAHVNSKSVQGAADTAYIGNGASAGVCIGSLATTQWEQETLVLSLHLKVLMWKGFRRCDIS